MRRQNHEALLTWTACRPSCVDHQSGRCIPGPCRTSLLSQAHSKAISLRSLLRSRTSFLRSNYLLRTALSTERALWKLTWFLRDFGYDTELLSRDQVDEKALRNLRGVVRTSFTQLNGYSYQNLDSFAPAAEWEALSCAASEPHKPE